MRASGVGFIDAAGEFLFWLLLNITFILLIIPLGLLLRIMGGDPLALRRFKSEQGTAFTVRNQSMTSEHLKQPF